MTILRHQGKTTVRQLLEDDQMSNHFRLRILHYRFSTLMDACLISGPQAPITEHYIPIKGKYKLATKTTSKDFRLELEKEHEQPTFKLSPSDDTIESLLIKIRKLKSVKTKSFALRLIHGDIYTGNKLFRYGLSDTEECTKCRHTETLSHLINECWYSGLIWTKIYQLYRRTDHRRQIYDKDSLDFVLGSKISHPKMKLHMEIIKRLTNKDRPNILPRMLISQTLDYLIICDTDHYKYYKKLKQGMQSMT